MKILSASFVKSAQSPKAYPPASLPEIAFAGKSNVGKSSLINALLGRKRLAKTSSSPGCTQLINFFLINDALFFVDLPGYGFAKVPVEVKRKWAAMVEAYLMGRRTLRLVIFLMDIRRDPGEQDCMLMQWLDLHGLPYLLVLTKADKLSHQQLFQRRQQILKSMEAGSGSVVLFSAKSALGREEVWRLIEKYVSTDQ